MVNSPKKDPSSPESEAPSAPEQASEDLQERLLRLAADFENFRKRAQREQQEALRVEGARILESLLPTLDNLDRALEHTEKASPLIEGLLLIIEQFRETMQRHGVKAFHSQGERFDPGLHEAVGQHPTSEMAPGMILEEVQRGYLLNERLLRPARVIVSQADTSDA